VENGGKDRKAYMIVPTEYLDVAKSELEKYKANLRRTYDSNYNPSQSHESKNSNRPTKIYIPAAAVMKNVNFMKRMSAADIWNAAPSIVRESTTTMERPQPATPVWKNTSRQDIANHDRDNASIGGANSISSLPTNAQRRPSLDIDYRHRRIHR
jgi:hypothetical protein